MLSIIAAVMEPLAPRAPLDMRLGLAGILIHTVTSLLNYGIREDEHSFDATVAEIKRMLVAYLFAVAQV